MLFLCQGTNYFKILVEKSTVYASFTGGKVESIIFEGIAVIDYSPFWETLKNSNENWYTLTSRHHMSHSTLHRLKHNQDISMKTINDLCRILNCQIQDICVYVPSDEDQPL